MVGEQLTLNYRNILGLRMTFYAGAHQLGGYKHPLGHSSLMTVKPLSILGSLFALVITMAIADSYVKVS